MPLSFGKAIEWVSVQIHANFHLDKRWYEKVIKSMDLRKTACEIQSSGWLGGHGRVISFFILPLSSAIKWE